MGSLHSNKIRDEKEAFVKELYKGFPKIKDLIDGDLDSKARRLHEVMLPVYIMRHYHKGQLSTPYLDIIITNLIETECLLILGFKNSAISTLRLALESSLKFLYYEHHPIESILHVEMDKHLLNGKEYRDFLYVFPRLNEIRFLAKEILEKQWSELCGFVHGKITVLEEATVVSDITSVLKAGEDDFRDVLNLLRYVNKVIVTMFFTVDKRWAQEMEKSYFDAVFDIFEIEERQEVKEKLMVV